MSRLAELHITALRNIEQASINCHPEFNLIHGKNGSGKTSVLEAISLVAQGKSFRTNRTESLIKSGTARAVVYSRLEDGHRIGIDRARSAYKLNLDGQSQKNWDEVLKKIPVLVLDTGAFTLLEGGPKSRRQFMDWGAFHVEPSFIAAWRRAKKCLANRNQLLKASTANWTLIDAWDQEFLQAADQIDQIRLAYLAVLIPTFNQVYGTLMPNSAYQLSLIYEPGWDTELGLKAVLKDNREKDSKYRFTQYGPQRADIVIKADSREAIEVLSRGQQKILVSALKIAQGMVQAQSGGQGCIYLVDDLQAELDAENRASVISFLVGLESQLFVTCVDATAFMEGLIDPPEHSLFHVEHGNIFA